MLPEYLNGEIAIELGACRAKYIVVGVVMILQQVGLSVLVFSDKS